MSGLVNKAKEVLSGNKTHDTTSGHTTSTHGHSGAPVHDASTLGTTHGSHATGQQGYGHNTSSTTAGPHSSNLANKLDPRVDSDADHRNNPTSSVGGYGQGTSAYGTTSTGNNTTAGPHSSNVANKLDPRVDSDADHRNNPTSAVGGGYGQTQGSSGYGTTHNNTGYAPTSTTGGTGTVGPHSSNLANKLDPRVDSDAGYQANTHGRTGGY